MRRNGFVHLNGRIVSAARAAVSVYDRGLLYGDGLFETMRAYRGIVFALPEHLERLRTSAGVLGIPVPPEDWNVRIRALLQRNHLLDTDAWVRLTITRGAGEPNLVPSTAPHPTVIILCRRVDAALRAKQRKGVSVTLLPYSRHGFIPEHKTLNYLPGVVGKVLAARHGAHDGLFVRDERFLTEGTTSSLFLVKGGVLYTSPIGGILPGVTRRLVIDIADRLGIKVRERVSTIDDLGVADEVFLTSSVSEIVPVVQVDQAVVGKGVPGPLTRELQRDYRLRVRTYCRRAKRSS